MGERLSVPFAAAWRPAVNSKAVLRIGEPAFVPDEWGPVADPASRRLCPWQRSL
jgi:hypothetical protein